MSVVDDLSWVLPAEPSLLRDVPSYAQVEAPNGNRQIFIRLGLGGSNGPTLHPVADPPAGLVHFCPKALGKARIPWLSESFLERVIWSRDFGADRWLADDNPGRFRKQPSFGAGSDGRSNSGQTADFLIATNADYRIVELKIKHTKHLGRQLESQRQALLHERAGIRERAVRLIAVAPPPSIPTGQGGSHPIEGRIWTLAAVPDRPGEVYLCLSCVAPSLVGDLDLLRRVGLPMFDGKQAEVLAVESCPYGLGMRRGQMYVAGSVRSVLAVKIDFLSKDGVAKARRQGRNPFAAPGEIMKNGKKWLQELADRLESSMKSGDFPTLARDVVDPEGDTAKKPSLYLYFPDRAPGDPSVPAALSAALEPADWWPPSMKSSAN